jgi:small-conductance mechanosensitive channel
MRVFGIDVMRLVVPLAVAGGVFVVGLVLRHVALVRLEAYVRRTASDWDDAVLRVLRGPIVLWLAILALAVAAEFTGLSGRPAMLVQRALGILTIASITWVAARIASELVGHAMAPVGGRPPTASLVQNVVRTVVFVVGGLVILQTLGISIVPIATALGVGGLAVALALQDTLGNFFAGLHILATRKIRPGDFIRLDSGEEGHVEDITWRHTTIRQLPNLLTIVPNAKLASAVVTNCSLPDPEAAVVVGLGVAYGSDLAQVERVTVEVAREVMREVQGGMPEFEPFIRFGAFADSSVDLNVIMRARNFTDQYLVKHEFIKRLHARYVREGIEIPFPQRAVHLIRTRSSPSS